MDHSSYDSSSHIYSRATSTDLLEAVLEKLPSHNLDGLIEYSPDHSSTFSVGGFSDIYLGRFKDGSLSDDTGPPTQQCCLICRLPDAESDSSWARVCPRCDTLWEGRLAVKKIRVHVRGRDHAKAVANELYVMSKVSHHPNILPFTGYVLHGGFPVVVTPWMEKGSLRKGIERRELERSEGGMIQMARGISNGLAYLHDNHVLHCDLKSDNILLSPQGDPLLADFGLSRIIESSMSINYSMSSACSWRWAAVELFRGVACYTKETDVWSFGMVLYEVMTHCIPYFEQHNDIQVFSLIISGRVPVWPPELQGESLPQLTLGVRNLCQKCWSAIPENRPSMRDVCWLLRDMARQPALTNSVQVEHLPMTVVETSFASVANTTHSSVLGTTANEHSKFVSRTEFTFPSVGSSRPPGPPVAGGTSSNWRSTPPMPKSFKPRNRMLCDPCQRSKRRPRQCDLGISGEKACASCVKLGKQCSFEGYSNYLWSLQGDYLSTQFEEYV